MIDMVTDDEILDAYRLLASREGIFGEPASAASVAGLMKMVQLGMDLSDKRVVCVITGSGLKDPDLAVSSVQSQVVEIKADINSLEEVILNPN